MGIRRECNLNYKFEIELKFWYIEYIPLSCIIKLLETTGRPHKRRDWLFVRNVKKCVGEY